MGWRWNGNHKTPSSMTRVMLREQEKWTTTKIAEAIEKSASLVGKHCDFWPCDNPLCREYRALLSAASLARKIGMSGALPERGDHNSRREKLIDDAPAWRAPADNLTLERVLEGLKKL